MSADVPSLSGHLDFRTVCGRFVSMFMVFMSKRVMAAKRNRCSVLKLKSTLHDATCGLLLSMLHGATCGLLLSMLHGATCGLLLSILFWGSNLLLQCGDVELNPGPPKADTMRQTRLGIGTTQQAALTTLRLKAKNRLWLTSWLCFLQ